MVSLSFDQIHPHRPTPKSEPARRATPRDSFRGFRFRPMLQQKRPIPPWPIRPIDRPLFEIRVGGRPLWTNKDRLCGPSQKSSMASIIGENWRDAFDNVRERPRLHVLATSFWTNDGTEEAAVDPRRAIVDPNMTRGYEVIGNIDGSTSFRTSYSHAVLGSRRLGLR
jgi:hypothetical protein